jgi:hypothetical protein
VRSSLMLEEGEVCITSRMLHYLYRQIDKMETVYIAETLRHSMCSDYL